MDFYNAGDASHGATGYDDGFGAMTNSDPYSSGDQFGGYGNANAFASYDEDQEPPLLEELGINFSHIQAKTVAVLNVSRPVDSHLMDDTDLIGPLVFCLLFGGFLLAAGKLQFGYIYGIAMLGCFGLYAVLNLMSDSPLSISATASVLGYSLLPMVALSSISILLNLTGIVGTVLAALSIAWCTHSASRIFTSVLHMHDQRILVAYPCSLLYGIFALLAIF
eukprot:TRINITY_DN7611_c0_g1_i1.p1 TRINITY_DN7611_c0_g1~~TRINITY_DN7611_c0_g1_i1.p1  ORF type:complete len:221 (+),score=35.48 TRINITY_DN7611_c0_g1_i1:113-775(+)